MMMIQLFSTICTIIYNKVFLVDWSELDVVVDTELTVEVVLLVKTVWASVPLVVTAVVCTLLVETAVVSMLLAEAILTAEAAVSTLTFEAAVVILTAEVVVAKPAAESTDLILTAESADEALFSKVDVDCLLASKIFLYLDNV